MAVSLCGLPVTLWSWRRATVFDSWGTLTVWRLSKGPLWCLKSDQRRGGLKSRHPAGRRSEETQTLARAIVRYTQTAGSHNFSPLYVFFLPPHRRLSAPCLIFCPGCWMAQLKVCEDLSDVAKKKSPPVSCLFAEVKGQYWQWCHFSSNFSSNKILIRKMNYFNL